MFIYTFGRVHTHACLYVWLVGVRVYAYLEETFIIFLDHKNQPTCGGRSKQEQISL